MRVSGQQTRQRPYTSQRGAALMVSLVFLLLLTLIGISSMQNATLQEKMAGSVKLRNQSFQAAELALRTAESAVQKTSYTLAACTNCSPPADAVSISTACGVGASGVTWVAIAGGCYAVQKIGTTKDPVNVNSAGRDESLSWTLYRITGVGLQGNYRTVVESVYAKL